MISGENSYFLNLTSCPYLATYLELSNRTYASFDGVVSDLYIIKNHISYPGWLNFILVFSVRNVYRPVRYF